MLNHFKNYVNSKLEKEKYVKRAEEQQNLRSESSRVGDPILPDNFDNVTMYMTRQGLFTSGINKKYAFFFKIHSSEAPHANNPVLSDPDDAPTSKPTYCWSLYVKILGGRTVTVW